MEKQFSTRSYSALNWLNFFAADVATGVGPFLAIYLAANRRWQPGPIGIAISAMSFATVLAQAPAGVLIERTPHKRALIAGATIVMGIMGIAIPFYPTLSFVTVAQIVMGIAGAFYGPTLIALAACLVARKDFDRTIGHNQTYNHAGNVVAAVLIGIAGRYTNNEGVFYCLFALAIGCCVSVFAIRLLFLSAAFVFHFANAAMLPLVGQEISSRRKENASLYMSACIILAQLVMVPVTAWCGRKAGTGRKWLLLVAFVILPVRGILYTMSANPAFLVSIQILDGVAAGIFGVVSILVVNDLMGSSGHASLAQAILATAVGLGASFSNLAAGFIVQAAGFTLGFLSLSGLALAALALLWIGMPETMRSGEQSNSAIISIPRS